MKKKVIKSLVLVIALVTVFSLVACTKTTVQTGIITMPPQGAEMEVNGSIKFSYNGATDDDKKTAADAFVSAFKSAYPDVKVERDYSSTSPDARISSGDIGDVFYFAEVLAYNYAISNNALMFLEYYMEAFGIDRGDVFSGIFDAGMINGHLYYVARDFNQVLFIYNADAVEQKALTSRIKPEWTWSEFLTICEELTDEDYYGAKINLPYAPCFIPFLEAYEGRNQWYSTASKVVDLTSGDTLKALSEAIDCSRQGYLDLMVGSSSAFSGKESVFNYIVYPTINSEAKVYDSKNITWDLINLPLFPHPAFGAGSSGYGVYNRTSNPTAAAAFALFFYTREGQRAFNGQTGGSVPLLASLKEDDFWKHPNDDWSEKNWDACVYMAEDYATVGQFNCFLPPEIADLFSQSALTSILARVIDGSISIQDGFKSLEEKVNQKWATLA